MVPLPGGVSFASRSLSEGLGWVYGEDTRHTTNDAGGNGAGFLVLAAFA